MPRRHLMHLATVLFAVTGIGAVVAGLYAAATVVSFLMLAAALIVLVNSYSNARSEGATQRANHARFRQRVDALFNEQKATADDDRRNYLDQVLLVKEAYSETSEKLRRIFELLQRLEEIDAHVTDGLQASNRNVSLARKAVDSLRAEIGRRIDSATGEVLEASALSNQRLAAWHNGLMTLLESLEADVGESSAAGVSVPVSPEPSVSGYVGAVSSQPATEPVLGQVSTADDGKQPERPASAAVAPVPPYSLESTTHGGGSAVGGDPSTKGETAVEASNPVGGLGGSHGKSANAKRPLAYGPTDIAAEKYLSVLNSGFNDVRSQQLEVRTALTKAMYVETQQTEALLQLMPKINPRWMMPPLGRWALDAQAMLHLWHIVEDFQPRRVLELGSGTSTVWLGYLAERIGAEVVSIEHDQVFGKRTDELVDEHGLRANVSVRHAPLETLHLEGRDYDWYSKSAFGGINDVDLLLIDGPIGSSQRWARYPAVPVLWKLMASDSFVILDDSTRPDENDCVNSWTQEFELESVHHGMSRLAVMRTNRETHVGDPD